MASQPEKQRIYDGNTDELMVASAASEKLTLVPDAMPSAEPDRTRRIRVMWGQHLLDDLLAGRYRSLVCAVNAEDNSHGIINQLADMLPTSQWDNATITDWARRFVPRQEVTVIKYDMDAVEVLALLRPAQQDHLRLDDLALGFQIVTEMVSRRTNRQPIASVSFLGAHANRLVDEQDEEPSFETVLRTMWESGFGGDVYPAPWMWESAPTAVFARYPFPGSVAAMREGGY
ncbi:MAG: hypothetical protein ACOCTI_07970 [Phycisphaeraceae bacterium]